MDAMKNITVGIPAYNASQFITQTIKSIVKQTVQPLEIIVVDDASTDNTHDVVSGLDVELFTNQTNEGIGFTRNKLAEKAKGDYVAFLSSDDMYSPYFIESSSALLNGKNASFTDYWRWNYANNQKTLFSAPKYTSREEFRQLVIAWALRKNMFVNFSTIIIPKRWFNSVSFESELRHGEDLIFLLDTVAADLEWSHIEEPLLYYRLHPQQGTRTIRGNRATFYRLWKHNVKRLRKLGVEEEQITTAYTCSYKNAFPSTFSRIKNKLKSIL